MISINFILILISIIKQSKYNAQDKDAKELVYTYPWFDIYYLDSQRSCRDVIWLIIPFLFVSFFIYCMLVFNAQYVRLLSSPNDGQGVVCGVGAPEYPYLYIVDPLNPIKRLCVKTCPFNITRISRLRYNQFKGTTKLVSQGVQLQGEHPALAKMNANKIYDSYPVETIRGGFCFPVDRILKDQLTMSTSMTWWIGFLRNFTFVWILTGFGILLCGVYIALLLYFPKTMDLMMPVIGGFLISTFGVNLIFYKIRFEIDFNKVMLGLFFFVFGALMLLCCWLYKRQLKAHGMFLQHAGKLIKSRMNILAHIFIYVVLSCLLLGICFYEFLAVWSTLPPTFIPQEIYYESNSYFSYFFTVLILIQIWWGLHFLKDSFNYTVSSIAADWYFNQAVTKGLFTPYFKIFRYYLGSIYYSSFVSALFSPFSFLQSITSPREMTLRVDRSCNSIWVPCMSFLNFVRPDALVIMDITGSSYKQSVRYRNQLCEDLSLYRDIHVASRLFRIGSYGFICGVIGYFSLYVRRSMVLSSLTMLFFVLIVISMFFVGIYADIAEALNILFLADQYRLQGKRNPLFDSPQGMTEVYNPQHKVMQNVPHPMNKPIYNPISEQIARKGHAEMNAIGDVYDGVQIIPHSQISRNPNRSTISQRIQNQLGYNFKSLAETGLR